MQSIIVNTYKSIRAASKVVSADATGLKVKIVLTEDNIKLLKTGANFNIVSTDILVEGNTVLIDNLTSSNLVAYISLIPKISIDLSEHFISETGSNFFIQFSKLFRIPENFYIHQIFSNSEFDEKAFIERLEFAIKVNEILNIIKDYKKALNDCDEFFLYATNPLIIKTFYTDENLSFNSEASEILNLIKSDFKSEVYKSFLKIQIINLLINVSEKDRFQTLLLNFKTIHLNFKNSIELYFKEFDFQKNKNELQVKKIELAKKIHGVVNEIGGKVITIPAAYLLILKELKTDNPVSILNSVFLFASIMFALIIESSIVNQFIFLRTLKKDIEEFLKHSTSSPELESLFERYKTELEHCYNVQHKILWFVRIALWFLPIAIMIILIYCKLK